MKNNTMLLLGAFLSLGLMTTANAQTFSTKTFSVEVPEEAMELADIEADEETIKFYESKSHEGGMGYIGTIQLYDKEEEYASIPHFEWAGAIVTPDGAEKQVIVDYPSDVQIDIFNEENIDRYHALSDLFSSSILPSLTAIDGEYLAPSQVNHKEVYNETLAQLTELLEAKADAKELYEAGEFSHLYTTLYEDEDGLSSLQVSFVDLEGTGYPEMAIMSENGTRILDFFAQKNGEVLHLLSAAEGNSYHFFGFDGVPNTIVGTSSVDSSYLNYDFYSIDSMAKDLTMHTSLIYDEAAPEGPYLCMYIPDEGPEAITEEEWTQWLSNYGEIVTVPGTSLID